MEETRMTAPTSSEASEVNQPVWLVADIQVCLFCFSVRLWPNRYFKIHKTFPKKSVFFGDLPGLGALTTYHFCPTAYLIFVTYALLCAKASLKMHRCKRLTNIMYALLFFIQRYLNILPISTLFSIAKKQPQIPAPPSISSPLLLILLHTPTNLLPLQSPEYTRHEI